ncbi:unnamed protein product, partial [marine sediment metagenome]
QQDNGDSDLFSGSESPIGEGEFEGEGVWLEQTLDAMKKIWPRDPDGKLFRFDRGAARIHLRNLPHEARPQNGEFLEGVRRWSAAWTENGYQHKASTFIRDRLWEQTPVLERSRSVTSRSVIKEES